MELQTIDPSIGTDVRYATAAVDEPEWWHYDFVGWEAYPVLDRSFAEIAPRGPR